MENTSTNDESHIGVFSDYFDYKSAHMPPGPIIVKRCSLRPVNQMQKRQGSSSDSDDGTLNGLAFFCAKPKFSYCSLIKMALKNSPNGILRVSDIYDFISDHFPYYKTANNSWKSSIRHNLCFQKCFKKIEMPYSANSLARRGCHWAINPHVHNIIEEERKEAIIRKMNNEIDPVDVMEDDSERVWKEVRLIGELPGIVHLESSDEDVGIEAENSSSKDADSDVRTSPACSSFEPSTADSHASNEIIARSPKTINNSDSSM